jgi:hypothetical protein
MDLAESGMAVFKGRRGDGAIDSTFKNRKIILEFCTVKISASGSRPPDPAAQPHGGD